MNLTWHIIKKDFTRLRPLLALWWGVLLLRAVQPALEFALLRRSANLVDSDLKSVIYDELSYFLMVANAGLLLALATSVVLNDSPIMAGAHWQALPISGWRMFRAKLQFLLLGCVLPALFTMVAAKFAYGFPPGQWAEGLNGVFWTLAGCITLGALMAALTRHPYIATGVAVGALFGLEYFYELGIWDRGTSDHPWVMAFTYKLMAVALLIIVCTYLTRRRTAALAIIGGTVYLWAIGPAANWEEGFRGNWEDGVQRYRDWGVTDHVWAFGIAYMVIAAALIIVVCTYRTRQRIAALMIGAGALCLWVIGPATNWGEGSQSLWDRAFSIRLWAIGFTFTVIAAALIIVVCTYRTRRRRTALMMIAVALCLFAIDPTAIRGGHSQAGPNSPLPESERMGPPGSGFTIQLTKVVSQSQDSSTTGDSFPGLLMGEITGLQADHPGEVWILRRASGTMPLPGVKAIEYANNTRPLVFPVNFPEALKAAGLDISMDDKFGFFARSRQFALTDLRAPMGLQLKSAPTTWQGNLTFDIGKLVRVFDIPAIRGAAAATWPNPVVIEDMVPEKFDRAHYRDAIDAKPEPGKFDLYLGGILLRPAPAQLDSEKFEMPPEVFYVLYNAKRHEAVPAFVRSESQPSRVFIAQLPSDAGNGIELSTYFNAYTFCLPINTEGLTDEATSAQMRDWLEDARLIGLRLTLEHTYEVRAKIDHLQLPADLPGLVDWEKENARPSGDNWDEKPPPPGGLLLP